MKRVLDERIERDLDKIIGRENWSLKWDYKSCDPRFREAVMLGASAVVTYTGALIAAGGGSPDLMYFGAAMYQANQCR